MVYMIIIEKQVLQLADEPNGTSYTFISRNDTDETESCDSSTDNNVSSCIDNTNVSTPSPSNSSGSMGRFRMYVAMYFNFCCS